MEVEAAKMIGAGIAAIALGGAGVGIGTIFGNYLAGALAQSGRRRQPARHVVPRLRIRRSHGPHRLCRCHAHSVRLIPDSYAFRIGVA